LLVIIACPEILVGAGIFKGGKTMKQKKILVPVDLRRSSESAFNYALYLARLWEAQITLLHVDSWYHCDFPEENFRVYDEDITVTYTIIHGRPVAKTLLKYIETHDVDLIIMETHNHPVSKHLFRRGIAEKMVRLSPIPVLTIHENGGESRKPWQPEKGIKEMTEEIVID
jgi:nucleotide-binding universal stress UspA family protein